MSYWLCCHPYFTRSNIKVYENLECSICLENLETDVVKLNCQHHFHYKCINQWFNKHKNIVECPMCRKIYKKY